MSYLVNPEFWEFICIKEIWVALRLFSKQFEIYKGLTRSDIKLVSVKKKFVLGDNWQIPTFVRLYFRFLYSLLDDQSLPFEQTHQTKPAIIFAPYPHNLRTNPTTFIQIKKIPSTKLILLAWLELICRKFCFFSGHDGLEQPWLNCSSKRWKCFFLSWRLNFHCMSHYETHNRNASS